MKSFVLFFAFVVITVVVGGGGVLFLFCFMSEILPFYKKTQPGYSKPHRLASLRISSVSPTATNYNNNNTARIDKTQQNSKCKLYGDRDETINLIISECSKLAQK